MRPDPDAFGHAMARATPYGVGLLPHVIQQWRARRPPETGDLDHCLHANQSPIDVLDRPSLSGDMIGKRCDASPLQLDGGLDPPENVAENAHAGTVGPAVFAAKYACIFLISRSARSSAASVRSCTSASSLRSITNLLLIRRCSAADVSELTKPAHHSAAPARSIRNAIRRRPAARGQPGRGD